MSNTAPVSGAAPAPSQPTPPAAPAKAPAASELKPTAPPADKPGQPAPAGAPAPSAAPAPAPAKHKLKVNGVEREYSLDELARLASKAAGAEGRFEEAARLRKEAEAERARLRDGAQLEATLAELGHDPRAFAEQLLTRALERELADPKDRALWEAKQQLEQERAQRAREAEERATAEHTALTERYLTEYEQQFVRALESGAHGLPNTPLVVQRAAQVMFAALNAGIPDLSADEALRLVREDVQAETAALLGALDGPQLVALLGEDVADRIRRWDVGRLATQPRPVPSSAPNAPNAPASSRLNRAQFRELLDSRTR